MAVRLSEREFKRLGRNRPMKPTGVSMTLVQRRSGQEGSHYEAVCPGCRTLVMAHRHWPTRVVVVGECIHIRLTWDDGIRGRVAVFWSRDYDPREAK